MSAVKLTCRNPLCAASYLTIQSFFVQSSSVNGAGSTTQASPLPAKKQVTPSPVCRFVNVKLCGVEPSQGAKGNEATVLLENPQGENVLDLKQLTQEVTFFPYVFVRVYTTKRSTVSVQFAFRLIVPGCQMSLHAPSYTIPCPCCRRLRLCLD